MTIKDALKVRGFAWGSIPDLDVSPLEFALQIGQVYRPDTMPLMQTLTPRCVEMESPSTYSGNYGVGEFPYHTDMAHWHIPPRYILLVCIVPDKRVSTKLVNWLEIEKEIGAELLKRARFRPRRRLNNQMYRLKVKEGNVYRWDTLFIQPVNAHGRRLKGLMEEIEFERLNTEVKFSCKGEFLLIDNWKMLHCRSRVPDGSARMLNRVYISELNE